MNRIGHRHILACLKLILVTVAGSGIGWCDEEQRSPITALAITGNGETVLSGSQQGIRIHRWDGLSLTRTIPVSYQMIHDIELSPDETTLAVAGGDSAESGVVELYAWPTLKVLWKKYVSNDVLYSIAFTNDGQQLIAGGHDHAIYLLNVATGEEQAVLAGHSKPVLSVAVLPNGKHFLSGSLDQTIRVWDLDHAQLVRSLTNHVRGVNDVGASDDAEQAFPMAVSVSDDKTVRFWQPTIGRMVRFKRLDAQATTVQWDRSGKRVFVGIQNQRLTSIDVQSLRVTVLDASVSGWINAIAIHPSKPAIAIGTSEGALKQVALP